MSTFMDHCASCGASITLDDGDVGRTLACYACGRRYYVTAGGLAPNLEPRKPVGEQPENPGERPGTTRSTEED
jgi:hypothetical protein